MKVSVVCPSYNREAFHENMYDCFQNQTWPDKELLILDDSPAPSKFFHNKTFPEGNVKYIYSTGRITVGQKTNLLIKEASGEIIADFDDDDFYAPEYLETMVKNLGDNDLITLSSWFVYSPKDNFLGFIDCDSKVPSSIKLGSKKPPQIVAITPFSENQAMTNKWGYGFSYVFKKSVCDTVLFTDEYFGSDYKFVKEMQEKGFTPVCFSDQFGLVLHIIHTQNLSQIFPQYCLPPFMLASIFGEDISRYANHI